MALKQEFKVEPYPTSFGDSDIIGDSNSSAKYIPLSFWTCFFVTSSKQKYASLTENNTFYKCQLNVSYALENECRLGSDLIPCGYWICVAITGVILLLGSFGIISNILNLFVLPKSLSGSSAKRLMILLAVFDLLAVICAMPLSILMVLILGRYQIQYVALEAFRLVHLFFSLGRTGSIFTTIMIAIERYIVIAYPLKQWLTPKKARVHLAVLLIVIFLVNLPWWISKRVEKNVFYHEDLQLNGDSANHKNSMWIDLSELPYIFKGTKFNNNIYPKIVSYHIFVDFALPFPVLLIFNGLLYRSVYISNQTRKTLTISERREVNAAKMFSIVVLILLLSHGIAVAVFVCTQLNHIQFRELQFLQVLATTLNCSSNFVVYYLFGKSFRDEFWSLVHTCKPSGRKTDLEAEIQSPSRPPPGRISNGTIELNINSINTTPAKSLSGRSVILGGGQLRQKRGIHH